MATPVSNDRPLLLGHRGARAVRSIPENTIQSFERALADGCDGFEFDVRRTADGDAVVCHDPRLRGIEIAQASGAQLQNLPRLEEVLARFHKRAFLDIELKVGGLEQLTISFLREYPPARGVVVSSFLPEVLWTVRAKDASVPLGLICETVDEFRTWRDVCADCAIPHYRLLNVERIADLKRAGMKILAWTVNVPREMLRCRDLGVDGILSDDAALLSRTLAGAKARSSS
ncbi:MAG TPA: glycerophosphodiester phosphodiesterase [Candidatus Eisenbacteria bacterium]|nr:glycerophosphodiester phosphodiesterase [Candidatus Eisenbacteria bacterium]